MRAAFQQIRTMPSCGRIYKRRPDGLVMTLLLPKTEQYLYFSVDREAEAVLIMYVWGSKRGRQPRF